jgi:8-oxo-dGTP pyrophosphatase MutT (NUDIX family)
MIDLYHRTTPEAAEAIYRDGHMHSKENTAETFWSTHPGDEHTSGYGSGVVHVRVPEHIAELDDEFPDGEQHYRVHKDSLAPHHFVREGHRVVFPKAGEVLRTAARDKEFGFHVTASWRDVQAKAKRIRAEGGVTIVVASADGIGGQVKGDHGTYESLLVYRPGTRKVADWTCGCKWAAYSWDRSPAFARFEGRKCSHALALQFEAQSQGMFGKEVHPAEPPKKTPTIVRYDPDEGESVYARPYKGSLASALVAQMRAEDADPAEIVGGLMQAGLQHSAALALFKEAGDGVLQVEAATWHGGDIPADWEKHSDASGHFHYPIHRGMRLYLDDPTHDVVHDENRPMAERAHALLTHIQEQRPGLGLHWTDQESHARNIANSGGWRGSFRAQPRDDTPWGTHTDVMIHAAPPHVDHIEKDPRVLRNKNTTRYGDFTGEGEVPLKSGAPVHVTGVSWDNGDRSWNSKWVKHDFDQVQHHTAGRADNISISAGARGELPEDASFHWDPRSEQDTEGNHRLSLHGNGQQIGALDWNPDSGEVGMVRTHPEYQRRGVATSLYSKAHDIAALYGMRPPGGTEYQTPEGHAFREHFDHFSQSPDVSHLPVHQDADVPAHQRVAHYEGRLDAPLPDLGMVDGTELGTMHTAAEKLQGPIVSGVALKAHDTGRVLMLQRGLDDEKDPARGRWEWPGGHHEDGDVTSLHAGIREWQEEVGQPFPEKGVVKHTWTSPDGVYQGHVVVIPSEKDLSMKDGRVEPNPDDPKGDNHEQAAWWEVEHAKKNPALRDEVKTSTPWKEIAQASLDHKEAAAWDPISNTNPQPGRASSEPVHSNTHNPASTGWAAAEDPSSWDNLDLQPNQLLPNLSYDAMLLDHPEPALPTTYGDAENLDPIPDNPPAAAEMVPDQDADISLLQGKPATPNTFHASHEGERIAAIVARFQESEAGQQLLAEPADDNDDIAAAAKAHLAKTALKNFTHAEQQELINEGADGRRARNFGDLQIEGTHYALLDALTQGDTADATDLFT